MTDAHRRQRAVAAGVVVVVAIIAVALAAGGGDSVLTPGQAIILGAVEGVTEFLPVSSTGHLVVAQQLFGLRDGVGAASADTYSIAIQLGAILAVVALYRHRLAEIANGLIGRNPDGRRLLALLTVAFLPAAVVGTLLGDTIKTNLFGTWPIIVAWAAGGLFLLEWRPPHGTTALTSLTTRHAAIIGTTQLLAFWPGTSRSLVTIAAALAVGATMSAAVEFSFLLGLVTLGSATALDLARNGSNLVADYGWRTPLLGALVALVTAVAAIRWLVSYLQNRPLTIFGWYRLAIAAVALALLAVGRL